MAKQVKKGEADDLTVSHNAKARAGLIKSTYQQLSALEKKRAKVSEEISELLNKNVKGDLGMKIADFKFGYRLYQLEGKDRDEMLDTLRESFEALGAGEQLDFFAATERLRSGVHAEAQGNA